MKVLVACPAHRDMLFRLAVDSVLGLKWPDGSRVTTMFLIDGDTKDRWDNLVDKLNEAKEMALLGGFDALLTIESDIVVPSNALELLSRVDTVVVYGLFVLRFGSREWNIATKMALDGTLELLSQDPQARWDAWGKVVPCVGHGQGICLIRASALKQIAFRRDEDFHYAQDWYFSADCQELGIGQAAHLGVTCGHIDENPLRVYWPEPKQGYYEEVL